MRNYHNIKDSSGYTYLFGLPTKEFPIAWVCEGRNPKTGAYVGRNVYKDDDVFVSKRATETKKRRG